MRGEDVRDRFDETGIVRLDGALSADQAAAIRDTVWRFVERRTETRLADPSTWSTRLLVSFKALKGRHVFAPFIDNSSVREALDAIFAPGGWEPPKVPGAQILLTMPGPGPWAMPNGWHMDCGFEQPTWPVFAVKLFAFFDDVEPEGGGTLLLSGSHRLVERYAQGLPEPTSGNGVTWGRFMKQDPWLDQLRRGGTPDNPRRELLDTDHDIDGIPLRAVELTGRPGDVVITHLHIFHTGAPNVLNRPRQMLGAGVRAADVVR